MTDNERNLAAKYPESVLFSAMAQSVWNGSTATVKTELAVTGKLKTELARIIGTDVQSNFITDSDVRHIKKQHGAGEPPRGQIDLAPDDFALIPLVLNEFDTVEHTDTDKLGNKRLLFSKKIDGIVYLATVERGPHKGEVKTLWKMT
jgi:hypothetical protein